MRLVGGTNEWEGRVEIKHHGNWRTICDHGWDDIDATVACRQLGFLNGTATSQAYFGTGSNPPVWWSQVNCLGNETKLSYCMHSRNGSIENCSYAGVRCIRNGMACSAQTNVLYSNEPLKIPIFKC